MQKDRILIVEDDNIVALDIQQILVGHGYEVIGVANSGREAIEQSMKLKPDLILMDIMLKGKMNGIEAAEEIRRQLYVPIIYLTAYTDSKLTGQAKKTEPFGYITKPFKERELTITVEVALYKSKIDKKMMESQEWLSTILRSIGDAVVATNREGTIRFMNPAAEAMTGWKQKEAVGKKIDAVVKMADETSKTLTTSLIKEVLQEEVIISSEKNIVLICKDGKAISVIGSGTPIKDEVGRISGAVLVFHDITTQKHLEEELLKKYRELEIMNKKKTDFLRIIVHELSTPLTVIIGLTHYLAKVKTDKETKNKCLETLLNELEKLKVIMNEIFLVDLDNQKEILYRYEKIKLNDLIAELEKEISIFLEMRKQKLIISYNNSNVTVMGDKIRLFEALFCIVQNASKFSEDNKEIFFTLKKQNSETMIIVEDQGIGIEKDELELIFTPFYEHQDINYHHSGSFEFRSSRLGMGLYWAKNIIEKHDGKITVSSNIGKGSKFTISLPECAQ